MGGFYVKYINKHMNIYLAESKAQLTQSELRTFVLQNDYAKFSRNFTFPRSLKDLNLSKNSSDGKP
jgi:hypothetical protein